MKLSMVMKKIATKKKMVLAAALAGIMSFGFMGASVSMAAVPAEALQAESQMKNSSISELILASDEIHQILVVMTAIIGWSSKIHCSRV